jgi:acyl-CoA synthetase (AMP-forming)/AMP-acid ligase II
VWQAIASDSCDGVSDRIHTTDAVVDEFGDIQVTCSSRARPAGLFSFALSAGPSMAHFTLPAAFMMLTELPKTATGKIQKYVLRSGRAAIARQ